jgi:Holliday junction resolvase-like predicted endonuclease
LIEGLAVAVTWTSVQLISSRALTARTRPSFIFDARGTPWWRGAGRPATGPVTSTLIAWQGPMLCFIEVKTRTAHDMTPAESAIDEHKRNVLRRLARQYVRQLPQKAMPPVRFDVISVYLVPGQEQQVMHFEASFGWSQWGERDAF